jgi:hypothetical protein
MWASADAPLLLGAIVVSSLAQGSRLGGRESHSLRMRLSFGAVMAVLELR